MWPALVDRDNVERGLSKMYFTLNRLTRDFVFVGGYRVMLEGSCRKRQHMELLFLYRIALTSQGENCTTWNWIMSSGDIAPRRRSGAREPEVLFEPKSRQCRHHQSKILSVFLRLLKSSSPWQYLDLTCPPGSLKLVLALVSSTQVDPVRELRVGALWRVRPQFGRPWVSSSTDV